MQGVCAGVHSLKVDMHHAPEVALAHVDGVGVGQVGRDPARPIRIIANLNKDHSSANALSGILAAEAQKAQSLKRRVLPVRALLCAAEY